MTTSDPDTEPCEALEERVARVVAVEGDAETGTAWLEPEPMASCSGCLSLASCGFKSGGGRGLAARRFPVANDRRLAVGERVVVGLPESSVLRASMTAYAVPLATMMGAAMVAEGLGVRDGVGALAIFGGLGGGLLLSRGIAGWLVARGDLAPRVLRRATFSEDARARLPNNHDHRVG